jgi:hypothetical protein
MPFPSVVHAPATWSTQKVAYLGPFLKAGYRVPLLELYASGLEPNFGDAAATTAIAQSISFADDTTVSGVDVYMRKTGTPTDGATVELRTDDGAGKPSTTVLETGVAAAADMSGTAKRWHRVMWADRVCAAGVTYWIVLRRTGAADAANYYQTTTRSAGGSDYPGGLLSKFNGTVWTNDAAGDLRVRVFGPETADALFVFRPYAAGQAVFAHRSLDGGHTWALTDTTGPSIGTNGTVTAVMSLDDIILLAAPYTTLYFLREFDALVGAWRQDNRTMPASANSVIGLPVVFAGRRVA